MSYGVDIDKMNSRLGTLKWFIHFSYFMSRGRVHEQMEILMRLRARTNGKVPIWKLIDFDELNGMTKKH